VIHPTVLFITAVPMLFIFLFLAFMHITYWNIVAVHGQGLFSSGGKAFSDFTS